MRRAGTTAQHSLYRKVHPGSPRWKRRLWRLICLSMFLHWFLQGELRNQLNLLVDDPHGLTMPEELPQQQRPYNNLRLIESSLLSDKVWSRTQAQIRPRNLAMTGFIPFKALPPASLRSNSRPASTQNHIRTRG